MSGYHNSRSYGPSAKKPRMGPRGPHIVSGQPHGDEDGKRLMSFKDFILTQNNDIDEQQALTRYSDYKTDFTRKQIDKFFKEHMEEEWFINKYRPTEIKKLDEANKAFKIKRKEVYNQMVEKNMDIGISVDRQHHQQLAQFLDNFSLLLEGATIDDIESGEARRNFKVSSIFFPSVHQSIEKSMIEQYASSHPSFLRVAMSEAQPDRDFKRRAWITYKHMDKDSLKQLVWEFNLQKFNGQETRVIVDSVMVDHGHIRYTTFWFCHKDVAKSDLKNVAKLLTHFEGEECPLLEDIKEHLIEETNEEEQLLGVDEQNAADFEFIQDPELFKALDRAILYLRVVHSFDYYGLTEYVGEDDMPRKIGLMFSRPTPSPTYGENPRDALRGLIEGQKACIDSFLDKPSLSEIEQKQLGKKNPEEEIENFIYQHTIEKKPGEKYVCKLTKKRFTAPEFVRKHIFNRCKEKLDEVRTEVDFFNNYVADPKRPM